MNSLLKAGFVEITLTGDYENTLQRRLCRNEQGAKRKAVRLEIAHRPLPTPSREDASDTADIA
jgi:hypothetical protein